MPDSTETHGVASPGGERERGASVGANPSTRTPVTERAGVAGWLRGLRSLTGTAPSFDVDAAPADPPSLFLEWLRFAVDQGVAEPHAATLSTIGRDGIPDARTLILKDVGAEGWAVAGPRSSRKAEQLAATPTAALNFWWQPLVRAVRVRGTVTEATPEEVDADLAARPHAGAGTSDGWMVWRIVPVRVEFWQGAPSRDHTRLVYSARDGAWTRVVRARGRVATTG